MAIYHKWKCVFIHIPKSGGTSIHNRLHNRTDNSDDHRTFFELLNENDAELFESYWSFSVVRNPYDKFISAFEFCKTVTNEIEQNQDFDSFVNRLNAHSSNFYSYVPIYFMPQHKFITIKNVVLVDELLRFENLNQDWKNLATKLNENKRKRNGSVEAINYCNIHTKLENLNVTQSKLNKKMEDYFKNIESKNIIYNLYKKDFELFNYDSNL